MSLYTWVIIGSIFGPLTLSFDTKVAFYKQWKFLLPSIIPIALLFLLWDEYFTIQKVWGFNPLYLSGRYIGHLPLEEVSFFLVVPYACIFIHEVLKAYFPLLKLQKLGRIVAFNITLSGFIFGIAYTENYYTSSACLAAAILTIGIYWVKKMPWFDRFAFTYLIVLIPFLIVNGILTGAFTKAPIVWYSEQHIIGLRIFTIPLEDLYYNYALLLPITALYEYLRK